MKSSLTIGFSALGANPLRTLLSTLGVIIGVASLVAVLSIGDGLERFTREQLETTPIQTIEVAPRTSVTVDGVRVPGTAYPTFTTGHAESLARNVGGIAEARLVLTGSARFVARGSERAAHVMGLAEVPALPGTVTSGRWFSAEEIQEGRRVAIVSPRLAELIDGDSLVLEGQRWNIIGVLPGQAEDSVLRMTVPVSVAAAAMVPSEWPRAPTLLIKTADVEEVEAVRSRVEQWLGWQDPTWPRGVSVTTNTARARQARQAVLVFKLAMGAIGNLTARGWDRHHERAAGVGSRTDPGDWYPQGDRRAPPRHPGTVSGRIGCYHSRGQRRRGAARAGPRVRGQRDHPGPDQGYHVCRVHLGDGGGSRRGIGDSGAGVRDVSSGSGGTTIADRCDQT